MNASFRAVSLKSRIPQQQNTVSGSRNACHGHGQGISIQDSSQSLLLHHMSPGQADQPAQKPRGRQLASRVSSRSPSPSRFSFDSLEQFSTSGNHRHREVSKVRGQRVSNICSRWFSIWAMEILSCAIASLCLAAIFGILYTHQGLPLPQWPLNITINALIAVFTAIFKMALMVPIADGISQFKWLWFDQPRVLADIERLDQASRGAWGSFLLLVSRVPRLDAIWLANLGAIITIASLAVDPFSQQIIQSEPCLQNIAGATAEIPKVQTFETPPLEEVMPSQLGGSLQTAIYTGLLSPPPNSSAAMTVDCRTGNCTFPSDDGATFSTLAMCHSCVDISNTSTYNESLYYSPSNQSRVIIDPGPLLLASTTNASLFEHSFFAFEALMRRETHNLTKTFAVACGLTACLKTFGANVSNGVYQEREVSSVDLVWSGYIGYSLATNMTLRNGSWQSCIPTTQNTTTNTMRVNTTTMAVMGQALENYEFAGNPVGMRLENISLGASLWYPDDCVWWLGTSPAGRMSYFLDGLFGDNMLVAPWWHPDPSATQGDLWLVNLYRNGTANMDTVDAFMGGLAWSVTAAMRQISPSENTPLALRAASGQMQEVQSCLTVWWAWLSLPASLLGLQLAFLVAIVVISGSAEHWHGDWKDSSLALLYHGLEGSTTMPGEKVESEELRDKDGMFKVARATKVQLRQGKDNWRFHTVP